MIAEKLKANSLNFIAERQAIYNKYGFMGNRQRIKKIRRDYNIEAKIDPKDKEKLDILNKKIA